MENVHERLEAMEGALQVMQAERQSLRRRLRCWRTAGFALIALILLLFGSSPGQAFDSTLEQRVAVLESLLAHFSRSGNEVYITGANLHIRNGLRATNGYLLDPGSISPSVTRTNGL